MKKFTFLIALLLVCWAGFGQVSYSYGWEPTGLGSWTSSGGTAGAFSRNTASPCTGTGAVRANTYFNASSILLSPNLGTSNGGLITLGYAYKALQFGSTTTGTPAAEVSIQVQYASASGGPWTTVQTINSTNHVVSAACATKTVTFTPSVGDLYVRFLTVAIGSTSDIHYYFDDISVSQGVAPSCLPPTAIASSAVTYNSATIGFTASTSAPAEGYQYYLSTSADMPAATVTPTGVITTGTALSALAPTTTYYVFVRSNCGGGDISAWSSAATFTTLASCFPPTALTLTGTPGATTASFNWTAATANPGSGYHYYLSTTSTAPTAATTPTGSQASGTTLSLTELTPNTVYYIWVRSNCGTGDSSVWTSSVTFRTDCTASIPTGVVETFTDFTTGAMPLPSCWKEGTGVLGTTPLTLTGTTSTWTNSTYNNVTGHANGNAVMINLFGTDSEWFVSPAIDLGTTTDYQLEYSASLVPWSGTTPVTAIGEKFVKVVVSTDGGLTWSEANVIKTYNNSNIPSAGVNEIISLANYTGTVKIGFYAFSTTTTQDLRFYVDNFKVSPIPQCAVPVSPAFVSATAFTGTFSWSTPVVAPASGYEYYISTTNTAPTAATTATGSVGAGVLTATAGSLTPLTTYYVWVRSKCNATTTSEWVGFISFTTLCNPELVLTTTAGSVCGQGTATLAATANATLRWFAAQTGGTVLNTGATYTTPQINTTTSYWVEAATEGAVLSGGKAAPATTAAPSTSSNYGVVFNLARPTKLESVSVYSTAAGTLNIKIMNAAMTTELYSTGNVNIVAGGTTTPNIIPLDIELPAGTGYRMLIKAYSGVTIVRDNAGLVFPYTSTDGNLAVTSSEWGGTTTANYYYFYDIKHKALCISPRQEIVATVTSAPAIAATTTNATICAGQSTTVSVTSANTGYAYVWMPGNLAGSSQTVSPAATTTYTVTATDNVSGCVTTGTVVITVNPLPTAIVVPATLAVCEGGIQQLTATGGQVSTTVFQDNFNAASTQFATGFVAGTPTSALSTTYFAEGNGAVLFNTTSQDADVSYGINSNVNLASYSTAQLTFSHIAALEGPSNSWDIGYVQYSADGGTTWTTFPTSSYAGSGTLITMQGTTVPVSGTVFSTKSYPDWTAQFTGATATPGAAPAASLWKTETINIPAAALTSQFRIRFRYTTDASALYYGWLIDNVKISAAASQVVWSPATNLFTNAEGTTAYVAGTVSPTVYVAAPATATTYTATATNTATGCSVSATVNVTTTVTPAPTVANATQTFCNAATVANLTATGTTIQWYAAATGGTALASTAALTTGTTYYASQTVNGCQSLTRTAVAVVINVTAAPTASAQTFCNAGTVANLTATGTGIQWYAAATGGTALAADAALATGSYYASQTLNGCESATRTAVPVIVNVTAAPTASAQTFCNAATVANLVATGTGVQWYTAATGGTALAADAALATGTYYASQTLNACESAIRTEVAVTVNVVAAPAAAAQTFCNAATVADLVATGTSIQWYAAATGGTPLDANTALVNGTTYYASQTVNNCEGVARTGVVVTVNVTAAPAASAQTFCNAATVADLDATGTGVQWYADATGGAALATDVALANGTTYYASQTVNGCESATRTAVAVTLNNTGAPTGSATQTITVNAGEIVTIEQIVVDAQGTVIWYATEANALAGEDALAAGTVLVSGTTYYATQTINGCTSATVFAVTVSVILDREDFAVKLFSYYPNPVTDVLTVSYAQEITSVTVVNLLGQQVIAISPNATEAKVDMTGLADGTYLVTMRSGNAAKTVKVVKGDR